MERQRYHGFLCGKIDADHGVVIGRLARTQLAVILRTVVNLVMMSDFVIYNPYGTQACGLGGHYVDTIAEIDRKIFDTRTGEFKHFVFHEAIFKDRLYKRYGHIVRTDTLARRTFQPHKHNLRSVDIPGIVEKLFYQFSPAFSNTHVS